MSGRLWSHLCVLEDLCLRDRGDASPAGLVLGSGWTARWVTDWRLDGTDVSCPVRDLVAVPLAVAEPVRRFGWRTRQRHRPGLQFMMTAEGVLTYFADRIDPTLEDTIG